MNDADKFQDNAATTAILVEAGIALMRQNIKRSHLTMNDEQIDALLTSWLCRAEDDIPGDTAGAVCIRERMQ